MLGVVDSDTHVAESLSMWNLIDADMRHRRPVLVSMPDDTLYKDWNALWLIDGNIFPKPVGKGGFRLITPSESKIQSSRKDIRVGCREITDVAARLADMDRLGVETQVVYPTLFLIYLTDDPELDVALCRAYNRFMARAWAESKNPLRWVVVPPLRSIEESVKEIKSAKTNGAVGVFFRGIEGNYTLDNPYFFPVYQAAMDVDLPICIHTGSGDAVGDSNVRPGKKPAVVPFGFPAIARFPRSCVKSNSRNVSSPALWFHRGFGKLGPVSHPQAETRQHQALEAVLEIGR